MESAGLIRFTHNTSSGPFEDTGNVPLENSWVNV